MLLLKNNPDIPAPLRSNFIHLVADIFWWGILNGTSLSFISVYLTRIGGSAFQLGLLAAAPALVNVLFALPVGTWLQKKDTGKVVFWYSIYHRIFFILLIPLPVFFIENVQTWLIIVITVVMTLPGTVLQIGFNDLFANAVPIDWRGYVAGIRNAALAITSILSSVFCGLILSRVVFPLNYQIVFLAGFIGAAFSSLHLGMVWRNMKRNRADVETQESGGITIRLNWQTFFKDLTLPSGKKLVGLLSGLFFFHFAQYLGIPVFPLYLVNELKLDDIWISLGNGLFFAMVFVISSRLGTIHRKFGNKLIVASGGFLMGLYPAFLAFSHSILPYMIGIGLGGIAWGLAGGLLYNYLLENIPENNRAPYLALYNLLLYAAVLAGSLLGPAMIGWVGITSTLIIVSIARALSGYLLYRWG